jgi:hypothetical protein
MKAFLKHTLIFFKLFFHLQSLGAHAQTTTRSSCEARGGGYKWWRSKTKVKQARQTLQGLTARLTQNSKS